MTNMINRTGIALLMFIATPLWAGSAKKAPPDVELQKQGRKVLWEQPADIASRDLMSGQGGREHFPASGATYEFVKEDLGATNPKFTVRDAQGGKWKIKLGDEARPETVATRFVWAVGFHTDEDYFLPQVRVSGLPEHVHRGQNFIDADGTMHNARLEKEPDDEKKLGIWRWSDGPFTGTREWNGLRVMMALVNNWDLKDENNTVYEIREKGIKHQRDPGLSQKEDPELIYVVSDLGAAFGPVRLDLARKSDKGDLTKFRHTTFIRRVHADRVDFAVPGAPSAFFIFNPAEYFRRRRLMWIGKNVPRDDARWIGSVLAQLSPAQIRDAFRAGGYPPEQVEAFASILQSRIRDLSEL